MLRQNWRKRRITQLSSCPSYFVIEIPFNGMFLYLIEQNQKFSKVFQNNSFAICVGFVRHLLDAFFFYDCTCLKKAMKLEGVGKGEFLVPRLLTTA
jgi:hypothetical protein